MYYKATTVFTSRDGRLDPDDREYGIEQEDLEFLGDAKPHLGGATQIFMKTINGPSNSFIVSSRDGAYNFPAHEKPESGWAVFDLNHGNASYIPDRGETGWWNVKVAGAPSDTVEGIGLPFSWHVSTFIVFEWVDEEQPEEPGTPGDGGPEIPGEPDEKKLRLEFSISAPGYAAAVQLFTDGTYTIDEDWG